MIAPKRVDLRALKQSVDLLALVRSRGHEPQRHGNGKWKIICPFHDDKEASLVITPSKSLWQCFGCGKGGSGIDFLVFHDHLTTGQAIRELASKSNGLVKPASELTPPEATPRTAQQQTLLNKATEFYHKALFRHKEGLVYLRGRGLTDAALLETFRVGYANETILEALPPEGDLIKALQAVGILDSRGKEFFRDCVIFPVFDPAGTCNVAGMYGRNIHPNARVKHLYLPGRHAGIFNHTCTRSFKNLLLTEGIIDAATLWQAGYKNVTALYGTNGLTEDHLRLFHESRVEEIYLIMDGDEAGRAADMKLAGRLRSEGLEVFSVKLPDEEDANSFFQKQTIADFDKLLREAKTGSATGVLAKADDIPQSEISARSGTEQVDEFSEGFCLSFHPTAEAGGKLRKYEVRLLEAEPRRLRVTIRAMTPDRHRFFIDTVDLYSARSRKTFVADVAELYHEEPSIIAVDVNRLVMRCEDRAVRTELPQQEPMVQLTEEERKEAERFGRRKDLLDAIGSDIEKCGYIGERANALAAYLTMTSRKMEDPLAFLVISGSGAGKSALQDTALNFCPPEELVKVTSLTERALFYKDEQSLRHKVLALEESAGGEDASYAIRNLISQKVLVIESTIKDPMTGRMTTMENRVYGPTAVFQTTVRPDMDPETRSRFLVTSIDESREQTRRVLAAQRKARTLEGFKQKLARADILKKHHVFQRLLKPLPVFNPFAELLTFNDERLLMRRDQPKYLALIDTIAFLRQMQKPVRQIAQGGRTHDYIEATLRDIALANELALDVLGKTLDELSGPGRRLLLLIEELVNVKAKKQNQEAAAVCFTRRELREFTRWSDYQIHHYLTQLAALEYLVPVSGRNGQQYQYRLAWDGSGKAGEVFVLGLKTVEQLRKEAELVGIVATEN